jgi:enamine deaminase RidA (YjgF/YER057c/UK114 family)
MAKIKFYNPDTIGAPASTYSHCALVEGSSKILFIAGQVSVDKSGKPVGAGDIDAQMAQVFANIEAALKSAGGGWGNVVQFIAFLVRKEDIPAYRKFRDEKLPQWYPARAYPPSTLTVISALAADVFLVEVQAIAAF